MTIGFDESNALRLVCQTWFLLLLWICVRESFPLWFIPFDGTDIHSQTFAKNLVCNPWFTKQKPRKLIPNLKAHIGKILSIKSNKFTRNHCINLCSLLENMNVEFRCSKNFYVIHTKPHVLKLYRIVFRNANDDDNGSTFISMQPTTKTFKIEETT